MYFLLIFEFKFLFWHTLTEGQCTFKFKIKSSPRPFPAHLNVSSRSAFLISFKLITILIFWSHFSCKPIFNWLPPLLLPVTPGSLIAFLGSRSLWLMLLYEIIIFRAASLHRCLLPTLSLWGFFDRLCCLGKTLESTDFMVAVSRCIQTPKYFLLSVPLASPLMYSLQNWCSKLSASADIAVLHHWDTDQNQQSITSTLLTGKELPTSLYITDCEERLHNSPCVFSKSM